MSSVDEIFLKGLLSKRLRIKIQDGRILDGNLMCTDNGCNLVLNDCEEYLTQSDIDEMECNPSSNDANVRSLQMAIIPGDQIVAISVEQDSLPDEVMKYINGELKQTEINIDSAITTNNNENS